MVTSRAQLLSLLLCADSYRARSSRRASAPVLEPPHLPTLHLALLATRPSHLTPHASHPAPRSAPLTDHPRLPPLLFSGSSRPRSVPVTIPADPLPSTAAASASHALLTSTERARCPFYPYPPLQPLHPRYARTGACSPRHHIWVLSRVAWISVSRARLEVVWDQEEEWMPIAVVHTEDVMTKFRDRVRRRIQCTVSFSINTISFSPHCCFVQSLTARNKKRPKL